MPALQWQPPAFAADAQAPNKEKTVQEQNLALANAQLDEATKKLTAAQEKVTKDKSDIKAYEDLYKDLKPEAVAKKVAADKAGSDNDKKTKATADESAKKTLAADESAVTAAQAAVDANTPKTPVHEYTKNELFGAFMTAKGDLDEAQKNLDDVFAKYDPAFVAEHDTKVALDNAQRSKEDYVRDNATLVGTPGYKSTLASLTRAYEEAKEAHAKALAEKTKFAAKWKAATDKFKSAMKAYKSTYDAALKAEVDLHLYGTPASLDHDFATEYQPGEGFVPGAGASHAGKPGAAKPGKPGQAAGQAGANGAAAGAKAEVENKKDKEKRGNTHTGTGVGVTLTALAATMLAGMGAAVRKARH